MKLKYSIRRVLNTGDFTNIAIEAGAEVDLDPMEDVTSAQKKLEKHVESIIEEKEAEILAQL